MNDDTRYYWSHVDEFPTENDPFRGELPFVIWKREDKYLSVQMARCAEEGDAIEIVNLMNFAYYNQH